MRQSTALGVFLVLYVSICPFVHKIEITFSVVVMCTSWWLFLSVHSFFVHVSVHYLSFWDLVHIVESAFTVVGIWAFFLSICDLIHIVESAFTVVGIWAFFCLSICPYNGRADAAGLICRATKLQHLPSSFLCQKSVIRRRVDRRFDTRRPVLTTLRWMTYCLNDVRRFNPRRPVSTKFWHMTSSPYDV